MASEYEGGKILIDPDFIDMQELDTLINDYRKNLSSKNTEIFNKLDVTIKKIDIDRFIGNLANLNKKRRELYQRI